MWVWREKERALESLIDTDQQEDSETANNYCIYRRNNIKEYLTSKYINWLLSRMIALRFA